MRSSLLRALVVCCGLVPVGQSPCAHAADPERQPQVSARGQEFMPFKLSATTHVFTKTKIDTGAIQQVVVKDPTDGKQIGLIRQHLKDIAHRFNRGDFIGPRQIHGPQMPGLAELENSKPGDIGIRYQDLPTGGQIQYSTSNASLVDVLHRWIDARLSDHGSDAREGSQHHHDHMMKP
jgi:hypothetical protein